MRSANGKMHSYGMNKIDAEVLGLWPHLLAPRYLAFQFHVCRVHVIQVGPFGQQQHAPSCE